MRRLAVGTLLLAAAAGCDAPRSRLHGTITHLGKPLAGAVVTFFGVDNMTYSATTGPDGAYAVERVPRGKVRVSVQVDAPRPRPRPDPVPGKGGANPAQAEDAAKAGRLPDPPPPSKAAPAAGALPAKYGDPNTSGLAVELKDADQEWSVDLK